MKSIEIYREKINNRLQGMDRMDTTDSVLANYGLCVAEQTDPVSVPNCIVPELKQDYLEREAILVIDGGVDEKKAAIQAAKEIEARCKPFEQIYVARCYILWGKYHRLQWKSEDDRRVYHNGRPQSICVGLRASNYQQAISKLNTDAYEFIEWCGVEL